VSGRLTLSGVPETPDPDKRKEYMTTLKCQHKLEPMPSEFVIVHSATNAVIWHWILIWRLDFAI